MRFFDPADLRAACGEEAGEPCLTYRQAFDGAPTLDPVRRSMVADAATFLPDDILVKVDRASMSVGLEARVPILDHRVARFALSLPLDVLWHGGVTKAPLREIAYRRIPSSLLDRPKQGFAIPVDSLLQNELTDWTARYLAPARLAEEGILDPEGVQRLRRAARRSGAEGSLRFLWFVLCFQRWYAHCHRDEDVC
jgi:asparagine synthase (glutamine-hydrolysing)